MSLTISHNILINRQVQAKNNAPLLSFIKKEYIDPEELYKISAYNYPKFFKMDFLCKWAWLGAENLLILNGSSLYKDLDKNKIGVVLSTCRGCLEVDKRYSDTITNFPSPALFVYTLPNIMLGEICIRHGFKGEQLCLVNNSFDSEELYFWANDLLENRKMDACLCGWVDAVNDEYEVCMFWITKNSNGLIFSPAAMQELYKVKR